MERKIKAKFSKEVIKSLKRLEMEEGKELTVTISEISSEAKKIESFKKALEVGKIWLMLGS